MTVTQTLECCARPPLRSVLLGVVARRLAAWFAPGRARNASLSRDAARRDAQRAAADDRRTAQALGGLGVLPR